MGPRVTAMSFADPDRDEPPRPLRGELRTRDVPALGYTQHLVDGVLADPDTIEGDEQHKALDLSLPTLPAAGRHPWLRKTHDVRTQARDEIGRFAGGSHQRTVSGVTWERSPAAADAGEVLIEVDTLALDAAWRKDKGYYLGFGGGADKVKYRQAKDFVSGGKPVHAPRVHLDASGALSFTDGRNRAAAVRDMDLRRLCVTVSKEDAERTRAALGG